MALKLFIFSLFFFLVFSASSQEIVEKEPSIALKEVGKLIRENRCKEAEKEINKVISVDKNQQEVYELRAMIHECLGETRKAEADYSALIHIDPENSEYLFSRGALRYKIGMYEDAIGDFRKATQAPERPTNKIYFHQRQGESGVSAISTVNTMSAESANFIGLSFLQLNEYDSAIYYFGEAISQNKKAEYYNNRALAYEKNDQPALAINDYSMSLEVSDYSPETLFNLIRLYGERGDMRQQEALIAKLEEQKELPELKILKGISAFNVKDYRKAVDEYSAAIKLEDENELYYQYRGQAYTKLKKFDEALSDLTKALELDATFPAAYFSLGNLYYDKNQLDSAILHYDLAILYDPDYGNAYMNRGLAKLRKKNTEEACKDLSMAKKLGVGNAEKFINQKCKDQ